MEKSTLLFDDFFVKNTDKKLIIKAKLVYHGLEKFGYYMISLIPLVILWYIPGIISGFFYRFSFIKLLLLIAIILTVFIITNHFVKRLLSRTILAFNKEKNTLKFGFHEDTLRISEIKNIDIQEEDHIDAEDYVYKLKFHLSDGSKTSIFAFTTFSMAKEIVDILKESLNIK